MAWTMFPAVVGVFSRPGEATTGCANKTHLSGTLVRGLKAKQLRFSDLSPVDDRKRLIKLIVDKPLSGTPIETRRACGAAHRHRDATVARIATEVRTGAAQSGNV